MTEADRSILDESYRLRILHLSDLHERVALDWMQPERRQKVRTNAASRWRVLGANFTDVIRELKEDHPIDLICFTGDVADWGLSEEYAQATEYIRNILDCAAVPPDRLFIVPGNHDINRSICPGAWRRIRRLAQANPEGLAEWMAGMDIPYGAQKRWRDEIIKRQDSFWRWMDTNMGQSCLLPGNNYHPRLGYRFTLGDIDLPFPVHIIGLDSAWLSGDDNDQGRLMVTDKQINILANDENGHKLPGFRLVLMHHPLKDLADWRESQMRLSEWVDLLLHGHQHEPLAEEEISHERGLHVIAAGSLYEGDRGDSWTNSFNLIDIYLDRDGQPLCYEIEFWGWSNYGHWYRTGALYREAPDGRLTKWTAHGEVYRTMKESDNNSVGMARINAGIEGAARAIEQLTVLNHEILWYISSAFEADILASENPSEKAREEVRLVLRRAYSNTPGVKIHVVPATYDGLDQLEGSLPEIVRRYLEQNTDISIIDGMLGIAIHHGIRDFEGAVIVIDGRVAETEVMVAEINVASILYMAVASIVFLCPEL